MRRREFIKSIGSAAAAWPLALGNSDADLPLARADEVID
jgi:hypothetical protein